MNIRSYKAMYVVAMLAAFAPHADAADATVSIEIVTERGVQATAQREWLQRITHAGADDIRIRGVQPGDEPSLRQAGSVDRPRYNLVGILDATGTLSLPGGRFSSRNLTQLRDYFERLAADGAEGVTAPRGAFGLTEKQIALVHDDLARPVGRSTGGLALADVLKAIDQATKLDIRMDDAAWQVVRNANPVGDEVEPLTIGTGLAIMLKRDSLVLVPTKKRGELVVHRIARSQDVEGETWPVGWDPDRSPGELAPAIMERLNAEVAGFTLAEAMNSIEPRMGLPVFWDHATLRAEEIDPTKLHVKLARQQTQLVRVVDRLLFQARLRGKLRVDEAGTVFYWISR